MYKTDQTVLRLSPYGYEQEGLSVWLHEVSFFDLLKISLLKGQTGVLIRPWS